MSRHPCGTLAPVKVYGFDEVDDGLVLLPMAARRALDITGLRLSRSSWLSLPVTARREIVELGSEPVVDATRVAELANESSPAPEPTAPLPEPPADGPPASVVTTFGVSRPVSEAVWVSLSALDRYALAKVTNHARPERIEAVYAEIVGQSALSTHLSPAGGVRMVDVGQKTPTLRKAVAESFVSMGGEAFSRLEHATAAKGDVLATARLAGIMAAKRTSELIPLCHSIAITQVSLELDLLPGEQRVRVTASVSTLDRTGVEMEALCAASVAALTVYDMLKSYDRGMSLGPTRLLSKTGGRSGDFER